MRWSKGIQSKTEKKTDEVDESKRRRKRKWEELIAVGNVIWNILSHMPIHVVDARLVPYDCLKLIDFNNELIIIIIKQKTKYKM